MYILIVSLNMTETKRLQKKGKNVVQFPDDGKKIRSILTYVLTICINSDTSLTFLTKRQQHSTRLFSTFQAVTQDTRLHHEGPEGK
jgi:hypothetical protein